MNNQLIKIDEVKTILSSVPEIVNRSGDSVQKCNEAGQAILDTVEGQGMNEAIDQVAAEYLKKVSVTVKNMNERRMPITQIFDKIRSFFTSQEKAIDPKDGNTIPGKVVKLRNDYAAQKYQEEQRRKQEAERVAKINGEKATYRQAIEEKLLYYFNSYLRSIKEDINNKFNNIALSSFDRDTNMVLLVQTDYPRSHFDKFSDDVMTYLIDRDTKQGIRDEILFGKYDSFKLTFKEEIEASKRYCIDRFASKKKELQEIENLRAQNAVAAAQAEAERKQREATEAAKKAQEDREKEERQRREIEAKAQSEQMASLFDQSAAGIAPAPTNAKVKQKVQVLHPAGYIEVFNMWWINEGQSLSLADLEKIFKKQITFCEKQANAKDSQFIESKYIQYIDDVKAK